MCQKCLRRFKRQGLGRLTYGQVKFYAHLMVKGFPFRFLQIEGIILQ